MPATFRAAHRRRTALAAAAATAAFVAGGIAATPAEAVIARPLDVTRIYYDPPGRDLQTNTMINMEYVQVRNVGTTTLSVAGYKITDAANHTFVFPKGFTIRPGVTVTIRTGRGTNTATTRYWQQSNYIWNNTGDTLTLRKPTGTIVERITYKGGGTYITC